MKIQISPIYETAGDINEERRGYKIEVYPKDHTNLERPIYETDVRTERELLTKIKEVKKEYHNIGNIDVSGFNTHDFTRLDRKINHHNFFNISNPFRTNAHPIAR